jgi:glycosyltransferase involved in cell wall biosynthesis
MLAIPTAKDTTVSARRVVIFNNMITPYTNRLFNLIVNAGHSLTVVSCSAQESNRSWADDLAPAYRHMVLPGRFLRFGPSRFAHLNSRIFRTLNALDPDTLVINGVYPSMILGALWAGLRRRRLIFQTDGWKVLMPNTPLHRLARRVVFSRTREFVVSGTKGEDFMREAGIAKDHIHRVPLVPGWDGPAQVASGPARPFDLVWCAHMENEVKNVTFFAEVCERLAQRRPDLKVLVVGSGAEQATTLNRLARASIAFEHRASVPWHGMAEVFSSARVLHLPSHVEAWGMVCNEAMQCGTPCIVSPFVGAGGDLVVDGINGRVLPLDADMWAAATDSLLEDTVLWSAMSNAARNSMAARSAEASAASLAHILYAL